MKIYHLATLERSCVKVHMYIGTYLDEVGIHPPASLILAFLDHLQSEKVIFLPKK
jgi:hypothetical protein